uniref:Dolichol phosphate-mannose biosynthesis regulatory protein n=1 Tax=Oryza barthii TaxID=65489 RepID=A0A0D3F0I6_9ORYZ
MPHHRRRAPEIRLPNPPAPRSTVPHRPPPLPRSRSPNPNPNPNPGRLGASSTGSRGPLTIFACDLTGRASIHGHCGPLPSNRNSSIAIGDGSRIPIWISGKQPFVDSDHFVHKYFLPQEYAILIPVLAGVILLSFLSVFMGLVMLKSKKKKKTT